MNKIERQKEFFNSISDEYFKARKNKNHVFYIELLWSSVLSDVREVVYKHTTNKVDVLEMMCGYAEGEKIVKKYITKDYAYTGFDYSDKVIDRVKQINPELDVYIQDVTQYAPEKKYDIIIIMGGLHHVPDSVDNVLHKIFQSLNWGGVFINFEPTHNNIIYAKIRNAIYKKNHIFDEKTEHDFELRNLNNRYKRSGLKLMQQYHVGLLAYILYYNPDAFSILNIGNKKLVALLQKVDKIFYQNIIGQKLSFATFSILEKTKKQKL